MKPIYIAIGSNINKKKNIRKCIDILKKKFKVIRLSSIYETSPVGYIFQPNFYNLVVEIETEYSPERLFEELMEIEKKFKRLRIKKNDPRTIDLDVLFYNNRIIKSKELIIPHPRLHKRAFVLVPLNEIAPNFVHPILKKSVSQLLEVQKGG